MTFLIAIDPGATSGVAVFDTEHKMLVEAYPITDVVLDPAFLHRRRYSHEPFTAVIEKPHSFPSSPARPDDIITLAVTAGRWQQVLLSAGAEEVELVWPQTWKGSAPKEVMNRRVLALLSDAERAVLPKRPRAKKHPYDHNMLDAVGIGLWKLGRTRR